jgi:hypothetical protein
MEKTMTRLEANLKLIETLKTLAYQYPDLRFSQMLFNFGFVEDDSTEVMTDEGLKRENHWGDDYYTESEHLLERVKEQLAKLRS